jgi:hypothetical protein
MFDASIADTQHQAESFRFDVSAGFALKKIRAIKITANTTITEAPKATKGPSPSIQNSS